MRHSVSSGGPACSFSHRPRTASNSEQEVLAAALVTGRVQAQAAAVQGEVPCISLRRWIQRLRSGCCSGRNDVIERGRKRGLRTSARVQQAVGAVAVAVRCTLFGEDVGGYSTAHPPKHPRATVGSRNAMRLSHAPHCCVLFSEQAGPHWSIATREPGGGLKLLPQKHWPLASTPATAPAPEYPNAQHSSAHSSYEWTV